MRLIVVDDHRLFREGLKLILTGVEGVEVVGEAGDGLALFELLERVSADVVLLDLAMSQMSGFQVLERLKDEAPELKALVLSMNDEVASVRRAIDLGAAGYLLKSAGKEELIRALRLVNDGYPYVQGELAGALAQPIDGPPHQRDQRVVGRQMEILRLLSQGLENKQIARRLGISETTVKSHLRVIYAQLGARSRADAVAVALRRGLIE